MVRLPGGKGLWLTVVTGVVIAGLAVAGVVASLGCGGGSGGDGGGGDNEPAEMAVEARMQVQVVTSAWVPVYGQTVYFEWRAGSSASGATFLTSSQWTTADNGWTADTAHVRIRRNSNLYVRYWLTNRDASYTMWTWEQMLENRISPTQGARLYGSGRLFLPGGGLEDP